MRSLTFLAVLMLGSQDFAAARTSPPPSKITVTVNGLDNAPWAANHNGTWTLTPVLTPETGTWVYGYVDNANSPRVVWGMTIDINNQINVQAYPGQFHPRWAILGDVYSIGGANQTVGGVTFLQIVAAP